MQSLDRLAKNYALKDDEILKIQNLCVGGCVVIQTNALNKRSIAFVEKVSGHVPGEFSRIRFGDEMEIEISKKKLEAAISQIQSPEYALKVLHMAEETGCIDLSDLIAGLVENGTDRRKLLASLRGLGIVMT